MVRVVGSLYGFKKALDKNITVKVLGNNNTIYSDVVSQFDYEGKEISNDLVNYIDPLLYKLPLVGNISISLRFESHPSASLQLWTTYDNKNDIKCLFEPGTELNIYGIGFRVNSISEVPVPKNGTKRILYGISISLGGKWENYVNQPAFLRKNGLDQYKIESEDNTECSLSSNSSNNKVKKKKINITTLARRVGAKYCGFGFNIEVPENTPKDQTINWLSEIQGRLRQNNSFIVFSNPECIKTQHINSTKKYNFYEDYLFEFRGNNISSIRTKNFKSLPDIQLNFKDILPGEIIPSELELPEVITSYKEENLNCVPYGFEYKNTLLDGLFTQDKEEGNEELTQGNDFQLPYRWKKIPPQRIQIESGDEFPNLPPDGVRTTVDPEHYDLSLNFDMSGPTKVYRVSISENGSPISEEIFTWGFAYLGKDVTTSVDYETGETLSGSSLDVFWQLIAYEKTSYIYDEGQIGQTNTGYLLAVQTSGWKLSRFKSESTDNPETVSIPIELLNLKQEIETEQESENPDQELIDDLTAERELLIQDLRLYQFRRLPINKRTEYKLEPYRKYYRDLDNEIPPGEVEWICSPSGKLVPTYIRNPNFVVQRFVIRETTQNICFDWTPNPENVNIIRENALLEPGDIPTNLLPPITTGEESYSSREIKIIPKNTNFNEAQFYGIREKRLDQDRYVEYVAEFNSLDNSFKSSINNRRFNEVIGRPPEAQRKRIEYEKVPAEDKSQDYENVEPKKEKRRYRYLLTTNPYTTKDPIQGSVSYPYAKTIGQAKNAVYTDLYINNVQSTISTDITIPFDPTIREFDRIWIYVNGEVLKRRVLGISHNLEIHGIESTTQKPFLKGKTTLNLGLDRDVNYQLHKQPLPKTPEEDENDRNRYNFEVLNVINLKSLGSIIPFTLQSRVNFPK